MGENFCGFCRFFDESQKLIDRCRAVDTIMEAKLRRFFQHFYKYYQTTKLFFHLIFVVYGIYGTAQFKLDRTRVQHGLNATRFSFCMCTSLRVHARLMTSNFSCKALVYALDVCTDARMHVRNAHTKFGLRMHANCMPKTAE